MSRQFNDGDERYLLVLDHDDDGDIQELVTVICEGRPTGARSGLDTSEAS